MNLLADLSPELRVAVLAAYRAWLCGAEQLVLFDLDGVPV